MSSTPALADRRRTADRIFRGALIFNTVLTLFWAVMLATHGNAYFFTTYDVTREGLIRVFTGILIFNVIWGFIWYGVKTALLRSRAQFSKEEVRQVFSSRMRQPFEVGEFVSRHSERRIRIIDMIGRRGRFITLGAAGFFYLYSSLAVANPSPKFATIFLQEHLFDAVVASWIFLGFYYSDGFLAAAFYGAQSRVMDGVLARAAEVGGSLFGKQTLRVWGIGDINRKSIGGTVSGFVACFVFCLWIVLGRGLPPSWIGLAVIITVSNTLLELFSPRGTDDFTMATTNALICWGFGALAAT